MTGAANRELFLLPCDHRSILRDLYLRAHDDDAEMTGWVTSAKEVVLDGLLQAAGPAVPVSSMGLLIDEEYGSEVAKRAQANGVKVYMPVDYGELGPFELQYGDRFVEHIERHRPDFVTALVEYAPAAPEKTDQLRRLEPLLRWLESSGYPFLLELQVPPTVGQLAEFSGNRSAWVEAARPRQIARSIEELKAAGARPAIWKIEACTTDDQYATVTKAMRADGQADAAMVVLGAGASIAEVSSWLSLAAKQPACIGFAVGRTVWLKGLTGWADGSLDRDQAVDEIATTYSHFCTTFTEARA